MSGQKLQQGIIFGIVVILVCTSIMSGTSKDAPAQTQKNTISATPLIQPVQTTSVSLYVFGKTGPKKQQTMISSENASKLYAQFLELKAELAAHPFSEYTQQLKEEFIALLAQNNLIPASIPPSRYHTLLNPPWAQTLMKHYASTMRATSPVRSGIASALICDMSGEGTGLMFPFIMLPRPRLVTVWMGLDGSTTIGKFLTIGGFTATGQQFGTALGFWGIGFAVAYPEGNIYGFAGYALFVTVTADQIESYPPNKAPIITDTNPVDNEQNVPLTLSELSFTINDPEGDLMSYTVTTNPDIGSGSGNLKPGGTYTIPIHGLQDLTQYNWTIAVSDTQHTTLQTFRFTTQAVAPIVSNPIPADGERHVPTDLQQLSFTLKDFQGDAMDYTVETSPFIGSGSGSNVHNGTYFVVVSGLQNLTVYQWFVNATDSVHWTRKTFTFQTWFPTHFDPFENGWHYRKQITIDHANIPDDLTNFPVFVSTVDSDLKVKAQVDGDDILFMNDTGFASLLNYEIEQYDGATGTLVAWVNIPQLSSQEDTAFYMYYGNPNIISLQDPGKTWNSNYQAVWHLNNNPSSTIVDSTVHSNNGTSYGGMTTSDLIEGITGKCLDFDGIDDYISVPDSSSLKPIDVTLAAWFRPEEQNPPEGDFIVKHCYDYWDNADGETYGFYLKSNHAMTGVFEKNTHEQYESLGNYPITTNTWYYLTLTFEESTGIGNFYVNGILEGTKNCDSTVLWYNDPWDFIMGGCRMGTGGSQSVNTFFNCALDEVQILNTPLGSAWVATEYANQNNPIGFYTIGPEVPGP